MIQRHRYCGPSWPEAVPAIVATTQTDGKSGPSARNAEVSLKLSANSRAVATQDQQTSMRAILLDWSPGTRGSRRGFARVKIGGMTVPDIPVCVSHGKVWASVPAKAVVRDGQQLVDAAGKLRWEPVFELTTQARNAFSRAVVEAVLAEHPRALDDRVAP
jgi:hypothetical protein